MKKVLFLVCVFLMGIVFSGLVVADDLVDMALVLPYVGNEEAIDSDIRLQQMGGLSLAVEDESNLIGLDKFGGNPAGMVLDYEKSKIEFDFRNMGAGEISLLAPTRKTYVEFEGSFTPLLGIYRGGDNAVGAVGGVLNLGITYPQSPENKTNLDLNVFGVGYSHQIEGLVIGGSVMSSNYVTKGEDTSAGSASEEKTAALILGIGCGYIIPVEDNELTLGLTLSIPREDNTVEDKINGVTQSGKYDDSLSGVGLGLQGIFKIADKGRIGLSLSQDSISGDKKTDSIKAGAVEKNETNIALRALYKLEENINMGFVYSHGAEDSIEKNLAETKISDDSDTSSDIGVGISYSLREDKGLVGVEYHSLTGAEKDKLDSSNDVDIKGTKISLGGEYNVDKQLSLRAGYRIRSSKETETGITGVEATMNDITLGAGYKLDNLRFDFMLIISDGEDDSTAKMNASVRNIGLMVKYNF
ncbi:porin [bacterium]|nr:porin [bacterium]MBU3929498.1 porin [bacterium]